MEARDILEVIGIVFLAGGFFVWTRMSIRTLRRDVNGLGAKMRARLELEEQRYRRTTIALLLLAPKEAANKIGELMKD